MTVNKVLAFLPYYSPSVKGGGPAKSLNNLITSLHKEYEFWIVTRDRDVGEIKPYANIKVNKWLKQNGAYIFYASPDQLGYLKLRNLINSLSYDLLYLNSFFSYHFSIKPLILRKALLLVQTPVLIAPRGEFSQGALQLKMFKKALFIFFSKISKLHDSVLWHASTKLEKKEIIFRLGVTNNTVLIAKNLPSDLGTDNEIVSPLPLCNDKSLRVVFLSRISPKKNLHFALDCLANVSSTVTFDIYGPKEDAGYWFLCELLIDKLPSNIKACYCGSVEPDNVASVFSNYDLFFFPTKGENYGHVIAESLVVGTPVLLSDQTPWRDLQNESLGWDLALSEKDEFVKTIESVSNLSELERDCIRKKTMTAAYKRVFNSEDIDSNRCLFSNAINGI